ncbi:MAG TPA: VOC family protein [Alphaproteobacteria bacterium]|jgi:catechol 2,3-dioxygenase-like lactoylglutathione lyase family enzyme
MAKINHIAIASDQYAINAKFYEALFGMKTGSKPRPARAVVVKDGYVGLNIIPRREGRASGLDHFGIEVDEIEAVREKIHAFDPECATLKRPPVRPFAAFSANDPDGNIFDLSQDNIGFQKDAYSDGTWDAPRRISYVALRTRHPERCAQFYHEVLGLNLLNKGNDDPNYYLSDGRMTLTLLPWKLTDYSDMDPARVGPDHIGFTVESVEAVRQELDELIGLNPHMHGRPLGYGVEGKARLDLFKRSSIGRMHITDIEGVYLAIAEHGDPRPGLA